MYHRLALSAERSAFVLGLFGLTLLLGGCSEEAATAGTKAATECARNDLVAQCPANTVPQLDVDAQAQCNASGSIDVSEGVDNLMGSGADPLKQRTGRLSG
jgi:hypothetical protein